MFLKVFTNKQGNALYYMRSVRKPGRKNPTSEKVEFLGYEEDLKKLYNNPIEHFKENLKTLTPKKSNLERKVSIDINLDEQFDLGGIPFSKETKDKPTIDLSYYMGQFIISKIYHELEIDQFFKNRSKNWGIKANLEVIFRMLIFGRILTPHSKLATWRLRDKFLLGNSTFTDDDIYRSFPFMAKYSEDLMIHLNNKVKQNYKRDTSLMFYNVTNYYFEIDKPDSNIYDIDGNIIKEGLRKEGVCKEHRPLPIVQLGLFMDAEGLPVSFGQFPGNNNDVTTFLPMIKKNKESFDLDKMIYIADKGMMSGTNIANILAQKQGYIISDKARKQKKDVYDWLFDENGYENTTQMLYCKDIYDDEYRAVIFEDDIPAPYSGSSTAKIETPIFKIKSRMVCSKENSWTVDNGKKVQVTTNKMQIAFWSRKYATKAKIERAEAIKGSYKNGTVFNGHGANKYFVKDAYNPKTGELLDKRNTKFTRYVDKCLVEKDAQYDGYYLIETNVVGTDENEKPWKGTARFRNYDNLFELNKKITHYDILEMYRGLWKIEESFKITKSIFKTRPMYVNKEESIHAHILTCFVSLLLLRILEVKKLKGEVPFTQIVDSLRSAQVVNIDSNIYMSTYIDSILQRLGIITGINMNKKYYTKQELRSLNNLTKKID